MTYRIVVLACVFVGHAFTADTGIGGSMLGYVFDPANGVQPLLGIAGSATIGPPLQLGAEITGITTSAQRNYALASTASDTNIVRITFGEPAALLPLGIPISATSLMALSPAGSAAAFYDRERNRILTVTGLPDSAALAGEFEVAADPQPVSLAVNDSGDALLIGFSDAGLLAKVQDHTITLDRRGGAMRFLTGGRDAVVADSDTSSVYLLRNLADSPEWTLLAAGISDPVAVAASSDNARVFVASVSAGTVTGIDVASGTVTVTQCACRPSALTGLNGNAIFRLTEPSGSPLWIYDGDSQQPRIVFIPPYQSPKEEAR
jgi:hypothetical protein